MLKTSLFQRLENGESNALFFLVESITNFLLCKLRGRVSDIVRAAALLQGVPAASATGSLCQTYLRVEVCSGSYYPEGGSY